MADLPGCRDQPAARGLDAADHFALHVEVPEEPVEALGDDDLRLAALDRLDRRQQPWPVRERGAAGDLADPSVVGDVLVPDVVGVQAEPVGGGLFEHGADLDLRRMAGVVGALGDANDPYSSEHEGQV